MKTADTLVLLGKLVGGLYVLHEVSSGKDSEMATHEILDAARRGADQFAKLGATLAHAMSDFERDA